MFNKYVEGCSNRKLDRLKFRDILHDMFGMTDDMLMDRGKYRRIFFNSPKFLTNSQDELFCIMKLCPLFLL